MRDVTIKVRELIQCKNAVDILSEMKIKAGKGVLRMAKLVSILRAEFKHIDESRNSLIIAHGTLGSDGNHFVDMKDEKTANLYLKALNELMDDKIEIRFRSICMNDFGDLEISIHVISDLAVFFDFEEDEIPDEAT